MLQYNGFYITTNKYLVVDTPVFDEIVDGIQILQFYPKDNKQEGMVVIAEYGEMDPHPLEIDVEGLREKMQIRMKDLSKEEKDEFYYKIEESKGYSKFFEAMNSIFKNNKEPQKLPQIYPGKYVVKNTTKILIHPTPNVEYQSAVGDFSEDNLSIVYHYGDKDYISIFKFVAF